MTRSINAEWKKIWFPAQSRLYLLLAPVAAVAMGLVFASTTQVTRGEALSQLDPMSIISANILGVDVVAVLLLLFAAVQVGREFRERTAQSYLAASPRRSTYFIAKSLAFGLVSLAVGAAVALAALLDGLLLVSAVGKQAPALAEVCRLAAGSALMPLFYVLLAVSATFCTRSTAAGAAIPFAVLFLPAFAELLPGALRSALVPLLPASAIHTLSGEARIGSAEHTGALVALAVLAAWALLPAVFAAWRFERTDM